MSADSKRHPGCYGRPPSSPSRITLRSLDLALCDKVLIEGRKVGTHFAWHILNALTLFLLLRASLDAGPVSVSETAEPAELAPAQEPKILSGGLASNPGTEGGEEVVVSGLGNPPLSSG